MDTAPKLGILAGGGVAPFQLVKACQDTGRPFHIVCLEGHAESDLGEGLPHTWLGLGQFGKFKKLCEDQGIEEIVMIGPVRRPSMSELKPDWFTVKFLTKIGLNSLGDDGVLRAIGKVLEEQCNVKLIGAADVFSDLLTPTGILTKIQPNEQSQEDIKRAVEIARTLGSLDVGQAVIVQQGIVLGVEAIEGTDALIARSGEIKREGQGGILVKLAKPQQDNRYDLPSMGVQTIQNAHEAGLAGIAIEGGRSLLIEIEKTIEAADMTGLFIVGLPLAEEPADE